MRLIPRKPRRIHYRGNSPRNSSSFRSIEENSAFTVSNSTIGFTRKYSWVSTFRIPHHTATLSFKASREKRSSRSNAKASTISTSRPNVCDRESFSFT